MVIHLLLLAFYRWDLAWLAWLSGCSVGRAAFTVMILSARTSGRIPPGTRFLLQVERVLSVELAPRGNIGTPQTPYGGGEGKLSTM